MLESRCRMFSWRTLIQLPLVTCCRRQRVCQGHHLLKATAAVEAPVLRLVSPALSSAPAGLCYTHTKAGPPLVYRIVLLGIDPDTAGAVAVMTWRQLSSVGQPLEGPGGPGLWREYGLLLDTCQADIKVFDLPVMKIALKGKTKGRVAYRRRLDVDLVDRFVRQVSAVDSEETPLLRAYIEVPPLCPLRTGALAVQTSSFGLGVWQGVLRAHGFDVCAVPTRSWKSAFSLSGRDKEGSRELAKRLFPGKAGLLRRKMDHGRAEALLLAAWGAGWGPEAGPKKQKGKQDDGGAPLNLVPLVQGPLRDSRNTDGYGNQLVNDGRGMMVDGSGLIVEAVDPLEEKEKARAARLKAKEEERTRTRLLAKMKREEAKKEKEEKKKEAKGRRRKGQEGLEVEGTSTLNNGMAGSPLVD